MKNDRIQIEHPRRDENGKIIPGQFTHCVTIETKPRPIEVVLRWVRIREMKLRNKKVAQ